MTDRKRGLLRILLWAAMLAAAAVLVLGLVWRSSRYLQSNRLPKGANGIIDLSQMDFERIPYLPLEEGWVFYPDAFVISDYSTQQPPSQPVNIPNESTNARRGSYKLRVENFPANRNLYLYVPNQLTTYRIYWNLYMVTTNQIKNTDGAFSSAPTLLNRLPIPYNYRGDIVIEVEGRPYCPLNAVPILTTAENYSKSVSINNTVVGLSYGAVLFCLVLYAAFCTVGRSFQSYSLLLLLFLCLVYCSARSAADNVVGYLLPFTHAPLFIRLAQLALYAVGPLLLAYNAQQLELPLLPWEKRLSGLLCLVGMGLFLTGMLVPAWACRLQTPCGFIWCLGALIPLWYLGRNTSAHYCLLLTTMELCLLLGLAIDVLAARGAFVLQATVWFPLLFIAMLLLLFYLYLLKIIYLQQQAKKAQENEIAMVRLRLENQQSEAALMLSQMRPHFLCNALLSIYDVNLENHEMANQAIIQFANYLRSNILSIGSKGPIPFAQELRHIENYVAIEKLRFEERLTMVYDIQYQDFEIPPLTVQPFVENAIKHGICKQLHGGQVQLRTWLEEDTVHIQIIDDGVGFQPEQVTSPGSIGIKNVRTRLKTMVGSTLSVESQPSVGTRVHITLKKGSHSDV
ncbi:MAG: histidine kinase [Eubacteriales bacterium]|nr:histidine kinase [Eubacteriales bacterium]